MRPPYMHVHRDDLRPVFIELQNTVGWIGELIDEGVIDLFKDLNELYDWLSNTMIKVEVLLRDN